MSEIYSYFTDEVITDFETTGIQSLAQLLETTSSSQLEREDLISNVFTELIFVYEEGGKLSLDQVTQLLSETIKDDTTAEIFCQVFDVFPLTPTLKTLIVGLYTTGIFKTKTLAQCISPEILSNLTPEVVPTATSLTRQLNIHKRDEFYTQKKYNLLHEVSEGYAKLIVEFYGIMTGNDSSKYQVEYALKVVDQLIGHYNLDPNRVLDLIIEIFINQVVANVKFVIEFLKRSQWWPAVQANATSGGIAALLKGGNETAAKLIGLRFLKTPPEKELPETFKILIAILIKEGFISFGNVYKYLADDVKDLEKEFKKDLEDKVFRASASALALAAPLLDDEDEDGSGSTANGTSNGPKSNANGGTSNQSSNLSKLEKLTQSSQLYQYLRIFLGNGLYFPSLYILTEHPFLSQVGEIPIHMNRLANAIISPFYNSPFSEEETLSLQTPKKVAFSRPNNTIQYDDFAVSHLLTFKPTTLSYSVKKFTYFYSQWSDDLPEINSMEDLWKFSKEFLKFCPLNLSQDLELYVKLCEIIIREMENDASESNEKWFTYFRNFLFPPIPLISENSFAIDKAFIILSKFPIEDRFNLYGEMYNVLAKNNSYLKIAYGKAEKSTKDVLKRLSKENVRPMMRRLAKISFSNPLPCFLTILQQIESYDNLNSLVVETARYFNDYGWDNLVLALLMRLTASGRSVTQADGMNDRQWIQSLSSFIGKVCQRYPSYINLKVIMTFLLKSFHNRETIGLIVLKEILISMGGIQSINNLTLHQIDMINCGNSLQKVVYRTIDDVRYERVRSGKVLVKTLNELGIVNELFIILCQLGKKLIYEDDAKHLKVSASKDDDLKVVLHLFTTLIGFFGKEGDGEGCVHLLSINEFCSVYDLEPEWAFEIWRYASRNFINDTNIEFNPCSKLQSSIYDTFWKLSLYDINFSAELYETELHKLRASTSSLKDSIALNSRSKDAPRALIEKQQKDLQSNESFIGRLPEDEESHKKHHETIQLKLKAEKDSWFKESKSDIEGDSEGGDFLQYCILPRAIHSSFDAAFCAKFLFEVYQLKVQNFSLIAILNQLFQNQILFGTLFTLTPTEAENLGLFYAGLLSQLSEFKDDIGDQIIFSYHENLLVDLEQSLSTKEYMSRRNAITFLKNLLGVYPVVEDHCEKVLDLITNISQHDERGDLKLSSNALIGHIKSKSKQWVHMWDFVQLSDEDKQKQMQKREEIQKKQEEELRKKREEQELQRKKQEEVEKKRIADAAAAAAAKANAEATANAIKETQKALRYDDSNSSASSNPRSTGVRGTESSKSRYDYYSKFGEESKEKEQSQNTKSSTPSIINQTKGSTILSRPSSASTKDFNKSSESKQSELKNKIKEAKMEYRKSRDGTPATETGRDTPSRSLNVTPTAPSSHNRLPSAPSGPTSSKQHNPPSARPPRTQPETTKRAQLPPQESIAKKDTTSQRPIPAKTSGTDHRSDYRAGQHTEYNRYNQRAYNSNNSNKGIPPPPPPPPKTSQPTSTRPKSGAAPLPPPPPPPPISLKQQGSQGQGHGQRNYQPPNQPRGGNYQAYDNRTSNRGATYDNRGTKTYDNRANREERGERGDRNDRSDRNDDKRKYNDSYQGGGRHEKRQRY